MSASILFPSPLVLLVTALVSGCVIPMPVGSGDEATTVGSSTAATAADGDATVGASSAALTAGDATDTAVTETADGTTATTTDATGPTTDDGSSSDTGPMGACADVPTYQCSTPFDCSMQPCGDVLFPFDADGCLRPPCSGPDECADDQLCLFPYETYGVCTSSGTSCADGRDGTCECLSTPDCGGGFCVTDCSDRRDAASCEADGCATATVVDVSDTCECTEDAFVCLDAPVGVGLPTGYLWHEETLRVAYFGRPFSLPIGWRLCTDAGAPPACGCFDPASPPACP